MVGAGECVAATPSWNRLQSDLGQPLDVASERGNTEIADVIRAGRTGGGGRQLIDGGVGVSEVLDF